MTCDCTNSMPEGLPVGSNGEEIAFDVYFDYG
jgi:hypothetical protein